VKSILKISVLAVALAVTAANAAAEQEEYVPGLDYSNPSPVDRSSAILRATVSATCPFCGSSNWDGETCSDCGYTLDGDAIGTEDAPVGEMWSFPLFFTAAFYLYLRLARRKRGWIKV
jgi:hypothetical protein